MELGNKWTTSGHRSHRSQDSFLNGLASGFSAACHYDSYIRYIGKTPWTIWLLTKSVVSLSVLVLPSSGPDLLTLASKGNRVNGEGYQKFDQALPSDILMWGCRYKWQYHHILIKFVLVGHY